MMKIKQTKQLQSGDIVYLEGCDLKHQWQIDQVFASSRQQNFFWVWASTITPKGKFVETQELLPANYSHRLVTG